MNIIGALIGIILAIIAVAILYVILKKAVTLLINAVIGVIILFLLNVFNVFSWFGDTHSIPINIVTILVCAIGGLPGVVITVVLHFLNIPYFIP